MPNLRNLAFFEMIWQDKMLFSMYALVWHVFVLFTGVGSENMLFGIF